MSGIQAGTNTTNRTETKPLTPSQPVAAALTERFDLAKHRRYLTRDLQGSTLHQGAGGFTLDEIETLRFGMNSVRPFVRETATPVSDTETDYRVEIRDSASSSLVVSSDDDSSQEVR